MAKIITISNTKGGTGKSTLVYFLHQYFTNVLKTDSAILDLDIQKTITDLSRRFDKGLKIINPSSFDEVHTLPYQFIFVDTPPYRTGANIELYKQSDFVLIPVKPSFLDAMATQTIISELRSFDRLKFACALTQVRYGVSFTEDIRSTLESFGVQILSTMMHQRIAYNRGIIHQSLADEADTKAQQEIADLSGEILTHIAK